MRTTIFTTIAGLSLLATPVAAADFRAPLAAKAPVSMAAPSYNWTGCYIGVHGGGGMMLSGWVSSNRWGGGAIAGGQIGCNYQMNMLVVGIEGEGWWSSLESKSSEIYSGEGSGGWNESAKNRWDAAVSLRVGAAFDTVLVYAKAGAAFGRFDFRYDEVWDGGSSFERGRGSSTLAGLLLGVGVEYAFAPNWTAKIEYNYINYAAKDVEMTVSRSWDDAYRDIDSVAAQKQIVKIGLNYKFGGHRPIVARY